MPYDANESKKRKTKNVNDKKVSDDAMPLAERKDDGKKNEKNENNTRFHVDVYITMNAMIRACGISFLLVRFSILILILLIMGNNDECEHKKWTLDDEVE